MCLKVWFFVSIFALNIRAIEPLRWTLKTDFNIK